MSGDLNLYRRSRLPREDQKNYGWKIKRAPASGALKLIVLSHDMLGIETHYWLRRTGPCKEHECEACLAGYESRWKGYVLCIDTKDDSTIVLEFTPAGAQAMEEGRIKYGSMRGMMISVSREKPTFNSKVCIVVKDKTKNDLSRFEVYGVWDVLSRIWRLKTEVIPVVSHAHEGTLLPGQMQLEI